MGISLSEQNYSRVTKGETVAKKIHRVLVRAGDLIRMYHVQAECDEDAQEVIDTLSTTGTPHPDIEALEIYKDLSKLPLETYNFKH